jgi:signal peptidase I
MFRRSERNTPTDASTPQVSRRSTTYRVVYTAIEILLVVVVVLAIRTWVGQVYLIPSSSMEPTLHIGDRVLVNKLSYKMGNVQRGDIVVFHSPSNLSSACHDTQVPFLIKRVIGLGGETISSIGNNVYINGTMIPEPWFKGRTVALGPAIKKQVIPEGDVFLLGDNRAISCDSRYWGPVPASSIVGKAMFIVWPISRISRIG